MTGPVHTSGGKVQVRVRLTPSGGADRIEGVKTDASGQTFIAARVRAAPEDGKANAALEVLVARTLGAPKSSVRVDRGATARIKVLTIEGVDESTVRERLGLGKDIV